VQQVLQAVFAANPTLESVLSTEGMLCVRPAQADQRRGIEEAQQSFLGHGGRLQDRGLRCAGQHQAERSQVHRADGPALQQRKAGRPGSRSTTRCISKVAEETIKKWSKDGKFK